MILNTASIADPSSMAGCATTTTMDPMFTAQVAIAASTADPNNSVEFALTTTMALISTDEIESRTAPQ